MMIKRLFDFKARNHFNHRFSIVPSKQVVFYIICETKSKKIVSFEHNNNMFRYCFGIIGVVLLIAFYLKTSCIESITEKRFNLRTLILKEFFPFQKCENIFFIFSFYYCTNKKLDLTHAHETLLKLKDTILDIVLSDLKLNKYLLKYEFLKFKMLLLNKFKTWTQNRLIL